MTDANILNLRVLLDIHGHNEEFAAAINAAIVSIENTRLAAGAEPDAWQRRRARWANGDLIPESERAKWRNCRHLQTDELSEEYEYRALYAHPAPGGEVGLDVVTVSPVVVGDWPDAHLVRIVVGNQSFMVGDAWETKDEADVYANLLRKALQKIANPTPGGAREGFVLVPVAPTEEMLKACDTIIQGYGAKLVYARMLAAAPQAGG